MRGIKRVVSKGKVYYYQRDKSVLTTAEQRLRDNLTHFMSRLLYAAKSRAAVSGIECTISVDDLRAMLLSQGFSCAVSGIPFELCSVESVGGVRDPWRPSLDRKDANLGYTLENCRLVCVAANFALNEWGDGVLTRLAHGIVNRGKPFGKLLKAVS